jgi:hypothetical protein
MVLMAEPINETLPITTLGACTIGWITATASVELELMPMTIAVVLELVVAMEIRPDAPCVKALADKDIIDKDASNDNAKIEFFILTSLFKINKLTTNLSQCRRRITYKFI